MSKNELRKIQKLNHSLMVTLIPKYLEELNIEKGDYVQQYIQDGKLIIKKTIIENKEV